MTREPAGGARALYDDVALYELLHGGYRDDLAFYRDVALDHPGVGLEIGAGAARVTPDLARLAEHVVAVEPAAAMRAAGAARLTERGLDAHVTWRAEPLGEGDPPAGGPFAWVAAPFHVLNEVPPPDAQDRLLHAVRAALADDGVFAFDAFAPPGDVADGVPVLEVDEDRPDGRHVSAWRVRRYDAIEQHLTSSWLVDVTDPDGRVARRHATLHQWAWHRFELVRALRAAGFARVRLFGDFDRRPVGADLVRFVGLARP
ncbi:MAG: hypothetical protein RI554_03090 [Trueperaceae bacterium]|nr:hypothetical protein [Trueperaceae bacterium]